MCLLRTAEPEDSCLIHVLVTFPPEPFLVYLKYQVKDRKTGTPLACIIIIVFMYI